MADNLGSAYSEAWMDAQQKFWQSWGEMSKTAMQRSGQWPQWGDALDLWWKNISSMSPPQNREMIERFIEQGKQYFSFNEQFAKAFKNMSQAKAGPEEWRAFWDQALGNMRDNMAKLAGGKLPAFSGFDPLAQWQKAAAAMGVSGQWLEGLPLMQGGGDWQAQMQKILGMPGVGYTREWQEDIQKMTSLWLEHQKAHQEYVEIFTHVGLNTITRLQNKLTNLSGSENPVSTLREVYDLWVDAAEDAYAEMANTEEYALANARLVNSLMAYKQKARAILDEMMAMMNMPTRRELNSVHKRLHDMKKENRRNNSNSDAALREEVAALRRELNALKNSDSAASASETVAPVRKTAPRKPVHKGE
jgi:polyhydroxyalkanoate synthase subunit PhaE